MIAFLCEILLMTRNTDDLYAPEKLQSLQQSFSFAE